MSLWVQVIKTEIPYPSGLTRDREDGIGRREGLSVLFFGDEDVGDDDPKGEE